MNDHTTREAGHPPYTGIYFKLTAIGVLILILQIPIAAIQQLISERIQTKTEAEQFVTQLSGKNQTIVAPVVAVPYIYHYLDDKNREKTTRAYAEVLPDNLRISSIIGVERRYRGVFEFPVYTAKITFEGDIPPIKVSPPDVPEQDILWTEAAVNLGISDPRTIRNAGKLGWNEQRIEAEPGVQGEVVGKTGIHFPIRTLTKDATTPNTFRFELEIGGSQSLNFLPVGRTTEVSVTSPWPHPSFTGNYLPVERTINPKGFTASWKITDLGRNFPRMLYGTQQEEGNAGLWSSEFGVGLYSPVDAHRMSERALKYELFVIGLTFLIFVLFEIFCALRIHSVQYLLVGAALVLFYLLLLSLSEHVGFAGAYVVSSAMVLALVAGYSRSVLHAKNGAATVGLSLALLYGFFYTLLQEEDYSLLIGSLGLTAILGFVMYLTRNLDWYGLVAEPRQEQTA